MLILTRRTGEALNIGDDIIVRVLSIRGHQVRIGIEAPRDVGVHREEIYKRILAEGVSRETPYARDDQATRDLLLAVAHDVPLDTISTWDEATIKAVDDWATTALIANYTVSSDLPPRPVPLLGFAYHDPKAPT